MAEELVEQTQDTAPVEAPVVAETSASEPKETKPSKPPSVRESLNAAVKEERARGNPYKDDKGKFTNKPAVDAPQTKAAPATESEPKTEVKLEASKPLDMPKSWAKDKQPIWDALPQEAKDFVLNREDQVSKGFAEYGEKTKAYGEIDKVIKSHIDSIQRYQTTPQEYFDRLGLWDKALQGPQKEQAFVALAQAYGISLPNLTGPQSSSEHAQSADMIAPLRQYIDPLAQTVRSTQQELERMKQDKIASDISSWSKDKPHFEKVKVTMGRLMQSGEADNLDDAYNKAVWANSETREELKKKEFEDQIKAQTERAAKAKAASISLQAKSPGGPQPNKVNGKASSVRESILAARAELEERNRA